MEIKVNKKLFQYFNRIHLYFNNEFIYVEYLKARQGHSNKNIKFSRDYIMCS